MGHDLEVENGQASSTLLVNGATSLLEAEAREVKPFALLVLLVMSSATPRLVVLVHHLSLHQTVRHHEPVKTLKTTVYKLTLTPLAVSVGLRANECEFEGMGRRASLLWDSLERVEDLERLKNGMIRVRTG